jgi:hypothetical protein
VARLSKKTAVDCLFDCNAPVAVKKVPFECDFQFYRSKVLAYREGPQGTFDRNAGASSDLQEPRRRKSSHCGLLSNRSKLTLESTVSRKALFDVAALER